MHEDFDPHLYFGGSDVLYTRDRQRPLFYHVLRHVMVLSHQRIVQGSVPDIDIQEECLRPV